MVRIHVATVVHLNRQHRDVKILIGRCIFLMHFLMYFPFSSCIFSCTRIFLMPFLMYFPHVFSLCIFLMYFPHVFSGSSRNHWMMHMYIQSGAAGCVKGFVTCFLRVPQGWTAAAILPKQARGTSKKYVTKPPTQPTAPDCRLSIRFHLSVDLTLA